MNQMDKKKYPVSGNAELIISALLTEEYQVRIRFSPVLGTGSINGEVVYGFTFSGGDSNIGKKINSVETSVAYHETTHGEDVLGFTLDPPTLTRLKTILSDRVFSENLKIFFKAVDFTLVSPVDEYFFPTPAPPFSHLQKEHDRFVKEGIYNGEAERNERILTPHPLGFLTDSEGWVYEPEHRTIFGQMDRDEPVRLFPGHVNSAPSGLVFYHVARLGRKKEKVLTVAEFESLLKTSKMMRRSKA